MGGDMRGCEKEMGGQGSGVRVREDESESGAALESET